MVSIYDDPSIELDSDLYSHSSYYRRGVRHLLRDYSRHTPAIVLSEHVKQALVEWGYGQQIWVVPPAVDPVFRPLQGREALRMRHALPKDKRLVLSVSNYSRRKNLRVIPEVMRALGGTYALVRVGGPLEGAISFSHISDETLNEIYNACDVLLFPSHEEGFGLPVLEAFAAGLPVVASGIPPITESSGGAALLVDPSDPAAIANGVREAVSNVDQLRYRGLQRATEYSLSKLSSRMDTVYQKLQRCGN
ncbi:MAG: glycosyltransferase [Euryarchaeota archaeon]|nr:glycosyltransferase [Euryarchaeota archaeon]